MEKVIDALEIYLQDVLRYIRWNEDEHKKSLKISGTTMTAKIFNQLSLDVPFPKFLLRQEPSSDMPWGSGGDFSSSRPRNPISSSSTAKLKCPSTTR